MVGSSHSLLRLYGLAITMLLTDRNFNTSIDGDGVLNPWFAPWRPTKDHHFPAQATKSSKLLNHTCAPWLLVLWWHPSLNTHVAPHLPCSPGSRGKSSYLSIWFNPQLYICCQEYLQMKSSKWSVYYHKWPMDDVKNQEVRSWTSSHIGVIIDSFILRKSRYQYNAL